MMKFIAALREFVVGPSRPFRQHRAEPLSGQEPTSNWGAQSGANDPLRKSDEPKCCD